MLNLAFQSPIDFLLLAIVVVGSLVLHEIAHGYAALWNGDPTAKYNGRLTLNPASHFDMVGFMMLLLVGFGYAKPVPVNPYNYRKPRRGIFTVAIAGVTVNMTLAFLASFFYVLCYKLMPYEGNLAYIFNFFYFIVFLNLNLTFFNLLPIYPLDGFRVVEAFTRPSNAYFKFMRDYGQYLLMGMIVWSIFVDYAALPKQLDILWLYIDSCRSFIEYVFITLWRLILGV